MKLGDRIFCFFSGGHSWWNINNLPRYEFKNNQLVETYDSPKYLCISCGVEKN